MRYVARNMAWLDMRRSCLSRANWTKLLDTYTVVGDNEVSMCFWEYLMYKSLTNSVEGLSSLIDIDIDSDIRKV